MTIVVDVVQGADVVAPGLSRAQTPLLNELRTMAGYDIRSVQLHSSNPKVLFPYVYGPLPARIWLGKADLVHVASSWYAHLVPALCQPVLVTCHDLIEISGRPTPGQPRRFHRRFHSRAAFRGLQRARIVVCDSQAVANMLLEQAPGVQGRVRVIYLGIADTFRPGLPDQGLLSSLHVRPPYLLYVGSEQPRKNLDRLVAACAEARMQVPDLQFVKVGHHQTEAGRQSLLRALDRADLLESAVILEAVEDSCLVELYRGAAMTALVSLHEGFGFPPLEAMACGSPAVVSNVDSLPEVTGGAALVVDPLEVGQIAHALVSLVTDSDLRSSMIEAGLRRARHFSWQRTARDYAGAYGEALDGS